MISYREIRVKGTENFYALRLQVVCLIPQNMPREHYINKLNLKQ